MVVVAFGCLFDKNGIHFIPTVLPIVKSACRNIFFSFLSRASLPSPADIFLCDIYTKSTCFCRYAITANKGEHHDQQPS